MKATFFHDSKFKYDKDENYYTTGGLTNDFLNRYLEFFEKLTIVTRKEKKIDVDNKKYSLSSGKNIEFECFDNLNILKLLVGKYKKEIKNKVKNSDFCIIRLHSFIGYIACHYAYKMNKPHHRRQSGTWKARQQPIG